MLPKLPSTAELMLLLLLHMAHFHGLQVWLGWDDRCIVCPKGTYSAPDRGINRVCALRCLDRPPCSGQAKLVPTAPLNACVMLAMAHLQELHHNVQPASAPSIRVSTAPLPPHLKTPSLPACNALTYQMHKSLVMSTACVRSTPPGLQPTAQVPLQAHPLVAHHSAHTASPLLVLAKSPCPEGITGVTITVRGAAGSQARSYGPALPGGTPTTLYPGGLGGQSTAAYDAQLQQPSAA